MKLNGKYNRHFIPLEWARRFKEIRAKKEEYLRQLNNTVEIENPTVHYPVQDPNQVINQYYTNYEVVQQERQQEKQVNQSDFSDAIIIPLDISSNSDKGSKHYNDSAIKKLDKHSLMDQKHVSKRDNIIDNVFFVLECIFKGVSFIDMEINLSKLEISLINVFLSKKFKYNLDNICLKEGTEESTSKILKEMTDMAIKWQSRKRKEEKLKFVYKNTIKYMKKQFLIQNQGISCESILAKETAFLKHYFEKDTLKSKYDIYNYSDPLKTTRIRNLRYKTLSNDYFILIFKIDKFKRDFFHYIDGDFKIHYAKKINKKFKKVLKNLKNALKGVELKNQEDVVNDHIEKIRKMKGCKLPWTISEIENAMNVFKEHINKLIENQKLIYGEDYFIDH